MTIHIQYVILIQLIHNKQAVFGSLAEFVKQYFQGFRNSLLRYEVYRLGAGGDTNISYDPKIQ